MNIIFSIVFIISLLIFTITNPDGAISAMNTGGQKAITLSLGLLSVYAIWSGLLKVAEDTGITNKLSKLLRPIINKLFKKANEETKKHIALNVSANLLGLGGIATPSGIKATTLLCDNKDFDGACTLFVLSATSLQIIPTTVISLRQTFGSLSPSNIFLPSLLTTVLSTSVGVFLCFAIKKRRKKQ